MKYEKPLLIDLALERNGKGELQTCEGGSGAECCSPTGTTPSVCGGGSQGIL